MTKRQAACAAVVLALLAGAAPAPATVGGPTLVDVLGWDAGQRRVYVRFIPTDAGGSFGDVVSFGLEAGDAGAREPWVRRGQDTDQDPALLRRLEALRRRLKPLPVEPAATMPWESRVVARDSVGDGYCGQEIRYRVRARWEREPEFEFTTWGGTEVLLKAVYRIPGRAERLYVFAFTGDRSEGGYETQAPVIVRPGETERRQVGGAGAH
jgi:hypothetical protein